MRHIRDHLTTFGKSFANCESKFANKSPSFVANVTVALHKLEHTARVNVHLYDVYLLSITNIYILYIYSPQRDSWTSCFVESNLEFKGKITKIHVFVHTYRFCHFLAWLSEQSLLYYLYQMRKQITILVCLQQIWFKTKELEILMLTHLSFSSTSSAVHLSNASIPVLADVRIMFLTAKKNSCIIYNIV